MDNTYRLSEMQAATCPSIPLGNVVLAIMVCSVLISINWIIAVGSKYPDGFAFPPGMMMNFPLLHKTPFV